MKKIMLSIGVILFSMAGLFAQANLQPSQELKAAMLKLDAFEGKWSGTGWIQMGPNRHTFRQEEVISMKANKTVLNIDGTGQDEKTGEIIHQAFAVIWYDTDKAAYQMMTVRADGKVLFPVIKYNEGGMLEWGFDMQNGGKIKFTIDLKEDTWTEKGTISLDGAKWTDFFEMNLKREPAV